MNEVNRGQAEGGPILPNASELKQQLESKVTEIKQIVSGVDEERASQPPATGEWCVKEVLTHLGVDPLILSSFKQIVEEDTPFIDVVPGQSHFSEEQRARTVSAILDEVETRYLDVAGLLGSLSPDQLQRKAHIPLFKQTPFGEYPTLEQWASGLINFHLADHVNQLRTLTQ